MEEDYRSLDYSVVLSLVGQCKEAIGATKSGRNVSTTFFLGLMVLVIWLGRDSMWTLFCAIGMGWCARMAFEYQDLFINTQRRLNRLSVEVERRKVEGIDPIIP